MLRCGSFLAKTAKTGVRRIHKRLPPQPQIFGKNLRLRGEPFAYLQINNAALEPIKLPKSAHHLCHV